MKEVVTFRESGQTEVCKSLLKISYGFDHKNKLAHFNIQNMSFDISKPVSCGYSFKQKVKSRSVDVLLLNSVNLTTVRGSKVIFII